MQGNLYFMGYNRTSAQLKNQNKIIQRDLRINVSGTKMSDDEYILFLLNEIKDFLKISSEDQQMTQ